MVVGVSREAKRRFEFLVLFLSSFVVFTATLRRGTGAPLLLVPVPRLRGFAVCSAFSAPATNGWECYVGFSPPALAQAPLGSFEAGVCLCALLA